MRSQPSIIPQARMRRVFLLMRILARGRYTVTELGWQLGTHSRTVYRYIHLLESLDVPVDQDFSGRYFIGDQWCPVCEAKRYNEE